MPNRHRSLFEDVEARTLEVMGELDREPGSAGLLHADLHPANIVFARGDARSIDFDDCGTGYWIYDLAIPAAWGPDGPDRPARTAAMIEGYERVRPFPGDQLRHLDLFRAARRVSNALWLADHGVMYAAHRRDCDRWMDVIAERVRSAPL